MKCSGYLPLATLREKSMPFYVATIGNPKYQTIVHRPLGIEDYQLLYTVVGKGECFINGSTYELKEGSLFYLPSNYPHEYHSTCKRWETLYITFHGSGVKRFFDFEPWIVYLSDKFDFEGHYHTLLQYKQSVSAENQLSVSLYAMLLELKDCLEFSSVSSRQKMDMMSAVLHSFSEEPQISLSDIARKYGISEEHFCRMFRKYTGFRPFEYINLLKIQKAKELLSNTDLDIREIAKQVGYESHSYFSMLFKKYMGETPTEYRKK